MLGLVCLPFQCLVLDAFLGRLGWVLEAYLGCIRLPFGCILRPMLGLICLALQCLVLDAFLGRLWWLLEAYLGSLWEPFGGYVGLW